MNPRVVISTVAALLFMSCSIIAAEYYSWKDYESLQMKGFQQYVHGFGLGATINPAWGFIAYDPRIDHVDETSLWPIPGGYSYSPDRGLSVSDFKENAFMIDYTH